MSLTTNDTASIIDTCDFYNGHIERPVYIDPWTLHPMNTYNVDRKCRQLREYRSMYVPRNKKFNIDTSFNYRNNKPNSNNINTYGIEAFNNNNNSYLFIILFIIILLCIKNNLI